MKKISIIISAAIVLTTSAFFLIHGKNGGIPTDIKWSERMALSVMKRNPQPWQIDFRDDPKWNYTQGLVLLSFLKLEAYTGNDSYYEYVEDYADEMVLENGEIKTYEVDAFNIDHINPGKILFSVYERTGEEKYLEAMQLLRSQLQWQPRTTEGGFWHKLRYPWQMWLDGLYMGAPYLARYTVEFENGSSLDDVVRQFELINEYAKDSVTGLLYHGWDESRLQRWSDPETGLSPHFWGRAMGWYCMALVDVLDFMPESHPGRARLITILKQTIDPVLNYQHESGLWYQIIDQGDREGNYLEASATCMFVYTIAKAVNKGYLPGHYWKSAEKGYDGILNELIETDASGEVHITQVCEVAGLGGTPFRDGSYEYYVNEPVRSNDPKAVGPFILASIELNK